MSKTYRKSAGELSEARFIDTYVDRYYYTTVTTRKTDKELVEENKAADESYKDRCNNVAEFLGISVEEVQKLMANGDYLVLRDIVFTYKRERVATQSVEDLRKEAKAAYAKKSRDGYLSDSSPNKFYKYLCKRDIRAKNKILVRSILKSEEDTCAYPSDAEGKRFIWSVW